jgi:ABC-type nitrate/sulfonate/bicarbonate transport system substrate-binding protein
VGASAETAVACASFTSFDAHLFKRGSLNAIRSRLSGGGRPNRKTWLPAVSETAYRRSLFGEAAEGRIPFAILFHGDGKTPDMSQLLRAIFATLLCTVTACNVARAQAPARLEVNVFPAGFIWPLWVAQDKSFFVQNGVDVHLIATPNSVQQLTGLIDGKFDIGMTAIDNVIAYMEGQGEAPTRTKPDLVAVMGSSSGFLSLMVAPDVKTFSDLRGRTLSVDAMTTGYAFTLRKMLELSGLKDSDYSLVKVGGMKERYEAMIAGKQSGTLSVPPFTLAAREKGFNELATALGVFKHYQGGVAAVRREWAASHRKELTGFIRGNLAALDWLYDPANKAEALRIFQNHLPGTSPEVAAKSYDVLLDPVNGFPKRAEIDTDGVNVAMDIRSQYGEPRKRLTDPTRYYDLSYYRAAIAKP